MTDMPISILERLVKVAEDQRTAGGVKLVMQWWERDGDLEALERNTSYVEAELSALLAEDEQLLAEQAELERTEAEYLEARKQLDSEVTRFAALGINPQPLLDALEAGDLELGEIARKQLQLVLDEIRAGHDRIPVNWRGIYAPGTKYERGDLVNIAYDALYLCVAETLSAPPTVDWELVIRVAASGGGTTIVQQGGSTFQNVYVQQTNPGLTIPGIWVETRGDGTVKTFWVNV